MNIYRSIFITLFTSLLMIGCNEFYLTEYKKCSVPENASHFLVGYLVNNNKPNGLSKKSLIVRINNKIENRPVMSIESKYFGKLSSSNYEYPIYGFDGTLYLKELEGSDKSILDKIKSDTIIIQLKDDKNMAETVLFYN